MPIVENIYILFNKTHPLVLSVSLKERQHPIKMAKRPLKIQERLAGKMFLKLMTSVRLIINLETVPTNDRKHIKI